MESEEQSPTLKQLDEIKERCKKNTALLIENNNEIEKICNIVGASEQRLLKEMQELKKQMADMKRENEKMAEDIKEQMAEMKRQGENTAEDIKSVQSKSNASDVTVQDIKDRINWLEEQSVEVNRKLKSKRERFYLPIVSIDSPQTTKPARKS